ncbi:MAG: 2-phosphosulfolactate phosphatase [Flavobacteriales bacterium]|jgi:2-phosphosulfolactate phosphatase
MSLENRKRVEVCFSPRQFELYKSDFEICVVIDVLRATTAICTAIDNGIESIIPVSTVEEAIEYRDKGYIAAAEREGKIVEGFAFGNSPLAYMDPALKGKTVVLTTTNGTYAISKAAEMPVVVIGALVNLDILCHWLIEQHKDVLLLGSGWKNKFNLEDTICAGAIADQLIESRLFKADEDSTVAAKFIYRSARENMFSFLRASSHRRRLRKLNLNEDVKYCLNPNTVNSIPILQNGAIRKLNYSYEPAY